jgi:hypothetical protein
MKYPYQCNFFEHKIQHCGISLIIILKKCGPPPGRSRENFSGITDNKNIKDKKGSLG